VGVPVNPYEIEGPAQISFSGGRSSGMMLCEIVEAHGGKLPKDVMVAFANTGKERPETLAFVDKLSEYLDVVIRWVEYGREDVTYAVASTKGEPFAALIKKKSYLPNPVARICTQYLKVEPLKALMGGIEYTTVAGIRADEPRRIGRMRERGIALPLVDAGVTREDVVKFWHTMPFDLCLPSSDYSNCDLCYLKGAGKLISLIREEPARADWWIEQEERIGSLFRSDRPNYATMKIMASQPQLNFGDITEDSLPCECVD
jgi:hypothetical protein